MLGFSTIIKLTMGLIVIFVVFGIVNTLFPDAMESFSEATHIEFPTFSYGKEKQQSDFKVSREMEENVKIIQDIFSSDNVEKDKITKLELKVFGGYQLIIPRNSDGNLEIVVKNAAGQTEIYNQDLELEYKPCIVNLRNTPFQAELVPNIIFTDETIFNIGNENIKYILTGLIKPGDNICFAGSIITLPGYLPKGIST